MSNSETVPFAYYTNGNVIIHQPNNADGSDDDNVINTATYKIPSTSQFSFTSKGKEKNILKNLYNIEAIEEHNKAVTYIADADDIIKEKKVSCCTNMNRCGRIGVLILFTALGTLFGIGLSQIPNYLDLDGFNTWIANIINKKSMPINMNFGDMDMENENTFPFAVNDTLKTTTARYDNSNSSYNIYSSTQNAHIYNTSNTINENTILQSKYNTSDPTSITTNHNSETSIYNDTMGTNTNTNNNGTDEMQLSGDDDDGNKNIDVTTSSTTTTIINDDYTTTDTITTNNDTSTKDNIIDTTTVRTMTKTTTNAPTTTTTIKPTTLKPKSTPKSDDDDGSTTAKPRTTTIKTDDLELTTNKIVTTTTVKLNPKINLPLRNKLQNNSTPPLVIINDHSPKRRGDGGFVSHDYDTYEYE